MREALRGLKPILLENGLKGFVEPLGFAISSLRSKREAIDAIDAIGGEDVFLLVHDSFHHRLGGEGALFPQRTGLCAYLGRDRRARSRSRACAMPIACWSTKRTFWEI